MPTGLGVDRDSKLRGTTPEDMQLITGAEYRVEGIISGAAVPSSARAEYTVMEGAVIMNYGTNRKIKVPFPRTVVPTTPNNTGSVRVDHVYVQQRNEVRDGDNLVLVGCTSGNLPPNSILLDSFAVPAGAQTTAGLTGTANRVYARPVGGQMGILHKHTDTDPTTYTAGQVVTRGRGRTITLPTERDVTIHLSSCVATDDTTSIGELLYNFYCDGKLVASWVRTYSKYWLTEQFEHHLVLDATPHEFYYTVQTRWPTKEPSWKVRAGTNDGVRFPGVTFYVLDHGVASL